MPSPILQWHTGDTEGWSYTRATQHTTQVIFELEKVPDFSSARFIKLGERLDDRRQEIARQQLQMLRQLHGLGAGSACSLRLIKDRDRLRLFVVVRETTASPATSDSQRLLIDRVRGMFPPYYTLTLPANEQVYPALQRVLRPDWASVVAEVLKLESTYSANTRPFFYVVPLLEPQALNDLSKTCTALLNFRGEGMIEITLAHTLFHQSEREWLSKWTNYMREAQSGERLLGRNNEILQQYPPQPELRGPVENNENLLKRYDRAQLFLYACRVYTAGDPQPLIDALTGEATRSRYQIVAYRKGEQGYAVALRATQDVDIAPEIHRPWWDERQPRPFAAQRLHRLVDVEEISSFFRLPIPMTSGFPGFPLDTGLWGGGRWDGGQIQHISLGTLDDEAGQATAVAAFNREALAKHGLIVGVPGSGKTTCMFNILHQLWASSDPVPFIVLEPAKTEYRALKRINAFEKDMLIFTVGDERISPFRFNPFELPPGIPLESHIARLNACFTGAFNLFDPLPLLLDAAIRETYESKGWLDDSVGGETDLEAPTLSDLARQAQLVIQRAGYSDKLRDDFNAALTQRLTSLMRGSKGRMLNVRRSIPLSILMTRPVVLELDALNDDEKALMMMFILTTVYEYAKATRRSGSPLRHMLVVEEAHNLIGRAGSSTSEYRANPREQAINLFVRMLAEMRALGQGILIADQLPTSLASEAVKNTNLKVLMRMTAKDDREDMGNTMDLDAKAQSEVVHFKKGLAYVYVEDEADVWAVARRVRTTNYKATLGVGGQSLEVPPADDDVRRWMSGFEKSDEFRLLFMPFPQCAAGCRVCDRRVRSQSERLIRALQRENRLRSQMALGQNMTACNILRVEVRQAAKLLGNASPIFPFCAYVHLLNMDAELVRECRQRDDCNCKRDEVAQQKAWLQLGQALQGG